MIVETMPIFMNGRTIREVKIIDKEIALDKMASFRLYKAGMKEFPHLLYGIGKWFFSPIMLTESEFQFVVKRYGGMMIHAKHW